MKKYTLYPVLSIVCMIGLLFVSACTPDIDTPQDSNVLDLKNVSKIVLKPSHSMIIANGKGVIDLKPMVYVKLKESDVLVPAERVANDMVEYTADNGMKVSRYFSTQDASLIGKTIQITASLKGTEFKSTAPVTVVSDLDATKHPEVVFPIVFHVIRFSDAEVNTGLKLEKEVFYKQIEKLNNAFSGKTTTYPMAVDTRIRFKPAIYAEGGQRLAEPGINRIIIDKDRQFKTLEDYFNLIDGENLRWNPQKYVNVWVFESSKVADYAFSSVITVKCRPKFKSNEATTTLPGLDLSPFSNPSEFSVFESGIYYTAEGILKEERPYSEFFGYYAGANDLNYFMGNYLGLFSNNVFKEKAAGDDYCDDTIGYYIDGKFYKNNQTSIKETDKNFFVSQNLMDDSTGSHMAISKQQAERIRWVLENCPERFAWKSNFAFTGK